MSGEQPWDFGKAHAKCVGASLNQEAVEQIVKDSYRDYGQAEERYRVALATEIVRRHAEEGVAWSTAPDLARGEANVARLRRERDIAEGVKEATVQAAWRRNADRKDAQRFSDWSQRRELAEFHGRDPAEPTYEPPIGGRG